MEKRLKKEALLILNKELAFQNLKKEKQAKELIIAYNELAFQNLEKEKRAAELIIANKELAFQNLEKEKRAAELIIANKELAFQNLEKEKRAAELIIANRALLLQNQEREKQSAELIIANQELKKAEEYQIEYINGLEQIMFMTSHKVRQPIANILGLSYLLHHQSVNSPDELRESLDYIKQSALKLDAFTKELTQFIFTLGEKGKIVSK
ncbi:diguanylate cyclase [Flavobacterium sp. KS-LB2]|uniref:diguanylate cyclase n=1 Tax=Flavobacterium sp. KS-LB2 TaxID=3120525 RepID=UPI0030CBD800